MNAKLSNIKFILLACLLIMAMPLMAQQPQRNSSELDIQLRKLVYAQGAIVQLYVDTVNIPKLTEDAIRGMLTELDPHSTYSSAKDVQALNEPITGSFEGIGVQFNMNEDTLVVIQPVSGGPSEKVGIIAGDMIVTVNDTAIAGVKMSKEEIMKRLRGPKGTKVQLGVIRRGVNGVQQFTVTRDKIPVYTLDAYYMIDPTTGYIRISSFGSTTDKEFRNAVDFLMARGMKDLVIDLQSKTGIPCHLRQDGARKGGGARRWLHSLRSRDILRSHPRPRPWHHRRSPHIRQRTGATPHQPARRL